MKYLIRLLDKHEIDVLRSDRNNYYSTELKLEIINRILLDDQSLISTAIEYGVASVGILYNRIKLYKKNTYSIVENK